MGDHGQLKKFEIWAEGYQTTGQSSEACYFGNAYGADFKDACITFFSVRARPGWFNPERMTHWGCRLFDNEQDARRSFG
jgi:hypothetical protein